MRAWYSEDMAVGLLYKCALGDIQPDAPVGEAGVCPLMSLSLAPDAALADGAGRQAAECQTDVMSCVLLGLCTTKVLAAGAG